VTAIAIEGLRKSYGGVPALDGLDLTVEAGAVFGFLGPNGAGKTTTIRILTGLARATSGAARVAGIDVVTAPGRVAQKIGHLPEEPAFYSWMTPREFVDHAGRLFGLPAARRAATVDDLLDRVGLGPVRSRRIGGFSRGMRQRLGLAQALVGQPEVLFLDEPVSALDPAGRKEVLELIDGLRGQCTVFMSTHILADVERVCDGIGIVARGRLVIQAPRDELLARYATPSFELATAPEGAASLQAFGDELRRLPWVESVSVDGPAARVLVRDLRPAHDELLRRALGAGVGLVRYELTRPSLEDVFLRLVGPESRS
jgi:ABC-2 type transport system ATP-binding protein